MTIPGNETQENLPDEASRKTTWVCIFPLAVLLAGTRPAAWRCSAIGTKISG